MYTVRGYPVKRALTAMLYAWQIGPFWQDTLELCVMSCSVLPIHIIYIAYILHGHPIGIGKPYDCPSDSQSTMNVSFGKTTANPRWHYQMETLYALLALCEGNPSVTGGFPAQRQVTRSFDVFFDRRLNKRLRKNYCTSMHHATVRRLLWFVSYTDCYRILQGYFTRPNTYGTNTCRVEILAKAMILLMRRLYHYVEYTCKEAVQMIRNLDVDWFLWFGTKRSYPILPESVFIALIGRHDQINPSLCFDSPAQDCSNSIANASELLQSCIKPPILSITSVIFGN